MPPRPPRALASLAVAAVLVSAVGCNTDGPQGGAPVGAHSDAAPDAATGVASTPAQEAIPPGAGTADSSADAARGVSGQPGAVPTNPNPAKPRPGNPTTPPGDAAVVARIVDGDTIHVTMPDGEHVKVRLLNIDTPEVSGSDDQCLGDQATAAMTQLAPVGTRVALRYDIDRIDRYGRTLAAVYLPDGRFLNAELARRGLGVPVTFAPNEKFRPPIDAAWADAGRTNRGLLNPKIGCTLPAQVSALEDIPLQSKPKTAYAEAVALLAAHDGPNPGITRLALSDAEARLLRDRILAVRRGAEKVVAAQNAARRPAPRPAPRPEPAPDTRSRTPRRPTPPPPSAPRPPRDTYTGCRAYGPGGTSIDNKGRRYTKIDCVTKKPL